MERSRGNIKNLYVPSQKDGGRAAYTIQCNNGKHMAKVFGPRWKMCLVWRQFDIWTSKSNTIKYCLFGQDRFGKKLRHKQCPVGTQTSEYDEAITYK